MSKIDDDVWIMSPDNTNVAEAAHALSNRREKNLKLVTTIIQYVPRLFWGMHLYCVDSTGELSRLIRRKLSTLL